MTCAHLHQHCEGRLCVCVECGAEIPSLDWGQVDELYELHQRFYSRQLVQERTANRKLLAIPASKSYNRVSKREIWNARQIA